MLPFVKYPCIHRIITIILMSLLPTRSFFTTLGLHFFLRFFILEHGLEILCRVHSMAIQFQQRFFNYSARSSKSLQMCFEVFLGAINGGVLNCDQYRWGEGHCHTGTGLLVVWPCFPAPGFSFDCCCSWVTSKTTLHPNMVLTVKSPVFGVVQCSYPRSSCSDLEDIFLLLAISSEHQALINSLFHHLLFFIHQIGKRKTYSGTCMLSWNHIRYAYDALMQCHTLPSRYYYFHFIFKK
jgi:hypothetical protein